MTEREALAQRGKRLEYFTIGWNSLEGLIAVTAGAVAVHWLEVFTVDRSNRRPREEAAMRVETPSAWSLALQILFTAAAAVLILSCLAFSR